LKTASITNIFHSI